MLTDAQLQKRDEGRNLGQELLAAAQEMAAGRWARKTIFEALPDGRVRCTVVLPSGTVERQDVLHGPQWQLLAATRQGRKRQKIYEKLGCKSIALSYRSY